MPTESYHSQGSAKTINDSASKLWSRLEICQRVEGSAKSRASE